MSEPPPAYDPESERPTGKPPPLPEPGTVPDWFRAALARWPGWREEQE